MAWTHSFNLFLLFLPLVFVSRIASSSGDGFSQCESTVKNWAESSIYDGIKEDKLSLRDLLFFLHVPRTGGRTYFHCILRKLYTSAQECPRSYDKLRFDPNKPNCRLVVSHDDYSLMSKLPKDRTSVVTVLRNPVDRVFSAYEFSIEVAARFLVHPNLTSATQMSRRIRPKSRSVSTLDIWPWKYLVPWMREDLFARRDGRNHKELPKTEDPGNPYNMEEMVMPLHAFIHHPVAHEIIHNGATFQIAGLTNNSYLPQSHDVRHCVRKHPELGQFVLDVAKSRLDHMLYVGLTEDHKKSAIMFANMVGAQVLSQSDALSSRLGRDTTNKIESTSFPYPQADGSIQIQSGTSNQQPGEISRPPAAESSNKNMTTGKLMEAYEVCVSSLRKSQLTRRTYSLNRIAPANFSKEARRLVPDEVIKKILTLNSLDVELYRHAQAIFLEEQDQQTYPSFTVERQKEILSQVLFLAQPQKVILSGVILLAIALVILVITARKRTSKLKI